MAVLTLPSLGEELAAVLGGGVLSMAQICLGRMVAGVFPNVAGEFSDDHIVHVAAGAMIATELGLSVTDSRGSPINWGHGHLPFLVVGWPAAHAQLIDMMTS